MWFFWDITSLFWTILLEGWSSSLGGWLLHHSGPVLKLRRNAKQTLSFRFRATIKIKVATTPIVWITDNSILVYFLVFMVLVSNHNVTHLGPQAFHLLPPVTWTIFSWLSEEPFVFAPSTSKHTCTPPCRTLSCLQKALLPRIVPVTMK